MIETYNWTDGVIINLPHVQVVAAVNPTMDALKHSVMGATFGVVVDGGNAILHRNTYGCAMQGGQYFVTNDATDTLSSAGGRILLITAPTKDCLFMVGGPVENTGRLRYIDGCTDSLIIPPWRKGEACLNLLHVPPLVEQTMHTHPSDRIGVVISGHGQCVTPDGVVELSAGVIWRIPADAPHRFRTDANSLRIIAWHPDSDCGMSDDDHVMLNRSLVNGVSARDILGIRTQ